MQRKDKDQEWFETDNLFLGTALATAGFDLARLDGELPRRAVFVFKSSPELNKAIRDYWDNSLYLPAQKLLLQQKALKDRLYQEVS